MNCFLCNNEAELRDGSRKGYKKPSVFQIYHCSFCKTTFSYPQVAEFDFYQDIYNDSSLHPGYARYNSYAEHVLSEKSPLEFLANQEEVYWAVFKAIKCQRNKRKKTKVLEVGCGKGYLSFALHTEGFNVTGMDISEYAIKFAKETYGDYFICADIFKFAEHTDERFDVVILTEVIEHVHNPIEFLETLKKILVPGGKLIVSTPENPLSDCIWETDYPPIHQWWFSKESMKFIGNKIELSCEFINFSDFYRKHYFKTTISSKKCIENKNHCVDESGKIITQKTSEKNLNSLKARVGKIGFLREIYHFILRMINWFRYKMSKKGRIICVVYEKPIH